MEIAYYSLGYNPETGKIRYVFANPYVAPAGDEGDAAFAHHTRDITVSYLEDGSIDIEAIISIVEGQAKGIAYKMELAKKVYDSRVTIDSETLFSEFGELYVAPENEEVETDDTYAAPDEED